MTVVQCWDDGVTTDVRLTDILRRHGAKATFNLNPGTHREERGSGWTHKNTEVLRLGRNELRDVYDGFTIGSHTVTHPRLERIPIDAARAEISEGRRQLQDLFGQPVYGFAYPCGTYNEEVMEAVREAGHRYARTTQRADRPFPPDDPMALHPCGHFLDADLPEKYEAAKPGGVFYFWGHSYEMISEDMWTAFEGFIEHISADPDSRWGEVWEQI